MKLSEIEKFIVECLEKEVSVPEDIQFHVDDFYDVVPEHMRNINNLEYNIMFKDSYKKIFILPPLI